MTKVKCKLCGQEFTTPEGDCPICFSDVLGDINNIKDNDERLEKLSDFINELTSYDYDRGVHNANCKARFIGVFGIHWEEIEVN